MKLTPALSAYFDFMRFTAALAVLLGHMEQDGLYMVWMPLSWFSHEAVVVFFVMSGFIICSTTLHKGRSWRDYAAARAARIYSVALPAIVFSVCLAWLVPSHVQVSDTTFSNLRPVAARDVVSSLFFLNESWLNSAALTLNGPYWSLCYEVWYYILFGAFFFVRGRLRWAVLLGLAVVAGPAVMVLFPVWAAGAWLAREGHKLPALGPGQAALLWAASIALVVAINVTDFDVTVRTILKLWVPGFWRLEGSQRLVTDYLVGIALLVHVHAFTNLSSAVHQWFEHQQARFTALAGFSFTLYLFHRPITQWWGYVWPNEERSVMLSVVVAVIIVAICFVISFFTERRLPAWRRLFQRALASRQPEITRR
jgi:peptidoglycan/LPS O-acetylase OafA/YrhL